MPFLGLGFHILVAVLLCMHAVRTGRETYWLWIILGFPGVGPLVYAAANVLPDVFGGSTARRLSKAARETLDPTREYRDAKTACDDSPTVRNQTRLAQAAAALGRHDEAEHLFAEAAHGIHAEDPALLLGRATALVELNRPREALAQLDILGRNEAEGRTPAAALALARAYEALGRVGEADTAYQWASQRLPGFEALARYTAFMALHGRRDEAEEALAEMDKRLPKLNAQFRKEARHWRDHAAKALAEA